jgi:hypothetical protein
VEHAAVNELVLIDEPPITEVLFECVVAVGARRGLVLDPMEDDLNAAIIASQRSKVLAEGIARPTELEVLAQAGASLGRTRYR